jgi:Ni2+-binding GTPase involved in maturation of urease and hydrogenase
MVGGFLGAGKTTALLRAAESLTARGLRVGLITNDQSGGLVDTALARSRDLPVEEIAGGCFCCRFTSLIEAAARLERDARPDVFLAEPVGSCTDLKATVSHPLRQMYGDQYAVAPLSVLIDPIRASRVLGVEAGQTFSPKVLYVYQKQLEEAELLVINKVDLLHRAPLGRLRTALERLYPSAVVLELSARTGLGMESWLEQVLCGEATGASLDIDYDEYADGEALLGWLNCTMRLAGGEVDGDELLEGLAGRIRSDLAADGIEIAHLKATLTPAVGPGIGVVNVARTEAPPEVAFRLDASLDAGELTLNLRAETDPARLDATVRRAVAEEARARGVSLLVQHLERFRPARPVPTYRVAAH